MPGPIEVFISYAPQDIELRRELEQHLAILKRQGLIRAWHVEQIAPGQGWRTAIESHVTTAQLILLLVSASFFASDDCHDLEMGKALERWQRGEAQVVPVLLSQCLWETSQLRRLRPLPDNGVPVTSWTSRAEAWANVARGIHRMVEQMAHGSTAAMPGAAVVSSRPARTIPEAPIQADPRASAPSYPAAGPLSPRAPAPSYPVASGPVAAGPAARPSAPSAPPAWTPSPVPSPHGMAAGGAPLRSTAPRRSSCLPALVAVAVVLAGVITGAVMLVDELSRWRKSESAAPPPVDFPATPSTTAEEPPPVPSGAGRAAEPQLCAAPCCGGSQCAVRPENTSKPVCVTGKAQCEPCTSGRTCIPGSCGMDLDPARPVVLRLAHTVIRARLLGAGDRTCVRRSGAQEWSCASNDLTADTQGGGPLAGRLTPPLTLTVADLMPGRGIDIWVGTNAYPPSTKAFHSGATHFAVNVTALCRGLKFKLHERAGAADAIGEAIFYLDDP